MERGGRLSWHIDIDQQTSYEMVLPPRGIIDGNRSELPTLEHYEDGVSQGMVYVLPLAPGGCVDINKLGSISHLPLADAPWAHVERVTMGLSGLLSDTHVHVCNTFRDHTTNRVEHTVQVAVPIVLWRDLTKLLEQLDDRKEHGQNNLDILLQHVKDATAASNYLASQPHQLRPLDNILLGER